MSGPRERWIWSGVVAALAVTAVASAEVRGRAARRFFDPPPESEGRRWSMVGDAAAAYRAWEAAGVRGRRLVVLTARWSKPRNLEEHPPLPEEMAAGTSRGRDMVDADSALFAAAQNGIARRLDVVMPPAAFEGRLAEVSSRKELVREPAAFLLPYQAVERRFSTPEAFAAPPEPALVLVEPSYFQDGAPPHPAAWLASRGAVSDLALVALGDPIASDAQRAAARRFAESMGASFVEVEQ